MKKHLLIIIFVIFSTILSSIIFYLCGHKNAANFIINFFAALGTCGAVFYAVYQSIPKKELVNATCHFLPTDQCFPVDSNLEVDPVPRIFEIELTNIGKENVLLPEIIHIDIYINKHQWESLDIPIENSRILIPEMPRKFRCVIQKDSPIKCVVENSNLDIYTWTENGTVIKVERRKLLYTKPMPIILED